MEQRSPGTILLVDDDAVNRLALGCLFRDQGFRVLEAGDGETALRLAEGGADLVLLDINLPDLTGFEVCQRLRSSPATRAVTVVQISAVYVGSGDRTQGLEGGADAYLIKPVEPRELLATVKALMRLRAAEEAARMAAQEWRTTFDAIRDPVCLLDGTGRVRRCNRALCELLGRDFAELLDQPLSEVLVRDLSLAEAPLVGALADGQGREGVEVRLGARWFRVSSDPVLDAQGACTSRVLILADVTRARELEERVRQGQRLEAIGRLAGGVAHDFNNLLTAILGNASLLAGSLPRGEPDHDLVATIERAAWRAAELTRQLLGFSQQAMLWFQTVSPALLLHRAAEAMRPALPASVELSVRAAPDLWPIQADPTQFGQVLANLCQNAVEAMPQGGRLVLGGSNEQVDGAANGRHPEAREGAFVRFRVEDTGEGIPPEEIDKIFDPFFTTKPVGRGPGLGLAMVHGIVKMHKGWVECHSSPGQGARFDLYVPRFVPDEPQAGEGGARVILLADDNDTMRALAAAYLRQQGHQVLEAGDGREAVEIYEREQPRIDLVILSQMMPFLSGRDALRQIRLINPDARALFAVGTAHGLNLPSGAEAPVVVHKPYTEGELVQAVRAALG